MGDNDCCSLLFVSVKAQRILGKDSASVMREPPCDTVETRPPLLSDRWLESGGTGPAFPSAGAASDGRAAGPGFGPLRLVAQNRRGHPADGRLCVAHPAATPWAYGSGRIKMQ